MWPSPAVPTLPLSSISSRPVPSNLPTAAILPPLTATSPSHSGPPRPSATRPLRMTRSNWSAIGHSPCVLFCLTKRFASGDRKSSSVATKAALATIGRLGRLGFPLAIGVRVRNSFQIWLRGLFSSGVLGTTSDAPQDLDGGVGFGARLAAAVIVLAIAWLIAGSVGAMRVLFLFPALLRDWAL